MPKVEIEIGDDGKVGTLPEPVQKFLDDKINDAHGRAYKKAAEEGQKQIDELKSKGGLDPVERERLRQLEKQAKDREIADLERDKKYEEAQKIRDAEYTKQLEQERQATTQARGRLLEESRNRIRSAALAANGREESLDELVKILGADIDLDENLVPFVKGADGKPAVDDKNQRITIEGYVSKYIEDHQHHKRAPGGRGGGAPGGKTFTHLSAEGQKAAARVEAAKEAVAKNPKSDAAINELFEANKALKAATGG